MKKINFKSLCLLLLSFASCDQEPLNIMNEGNDSLNIIDVVSKGRSAGDGKYDVLGHGYDITNSYLDPKGCGALIFDINELEKKNLIQPYKLEESQFRYESGKDVYEFTSNMSSSVKIDEPGFMKVVAGGALNIAFGGNYTYSSDYSFAYCTQEYVDSRYRIAESDINVLRTCLTQQFIERILTYTPQQIVEEYGTHVLKDIYVGAKLEVYLMAKSTNSSKKENIEASLGVSLLKIFNLDAKFHYDSSLALNNKQQSLYYSTVGGDPMAGLTGALNP